MYSLIQKLNNLPVEKKKKIIDGLSIEEKMALLSSPLFRLRPDQIEPNVDYKRWIICAGRGYGKTFAGAAWVIDRAKRFPGTSIAIIAQTKADARDTIIKTGPSSILNISPADFMPEYIPSNRILRWPNDSYALIYSGDEPEQLRGGNWQFAYMDEVCKYLYLSDVLYNLDFGLRMGDKQQICVTTTPKPSKLFSDMLKEKGTVVTTGSTLANISNLPASFIETILERYDGTSIGRQELYGELLSDVEGAIWSRGIIDSCRIPLRDLPDSFEKISISVDVATTSKANSDKTGIIVVGILNKEAYVLEDATNKYSPTETGTKICSLHDKYKKYTLNIAIIVEKNAGNDYITSVIRLVEKSLDRKHPLVIKEVHANKSKKHRALNVFGLYEQKRVYHVGFFGDLEEQMCTWTEESKDSPDNMDALVWSLTELITDKKIEHKTTQNGLW